MSVQHACMMNVTAYLGILARWNGLKVGLLFKLGKTLMSKFLASFSSLRMLTVEPLAFSLRSCCSVSRQKIIRWGHWLQYGHTCLARLAS